MVHNKIIKIARYNEISVALGSKINVAVKIK
jgi:hypothetical protein